MAAHVYLWLAPLPASDTVLTPIMPAPSIYHLITNATALRQKAAAND